MVKLFMGFRNREEQRSYNLKKKYNLSLRDYQRMFEAQVGCCALCKRHQSDFPRGYSLSVDHDHSTGKVRGLLCYFCNKLLGRLEDKQYFERIQSYLARKPEVTEIDKFGKVVYN